MSHSHKIFELKDIGISGIPQVVEALRAVFEASSNKKNILLMKGPMAAGKTTLVRFLVEALGGQGVQSPTFALHQRYQLPQFDIEHLDLYRMNSPLELDGLGFWDFFEVTAGIIIIEWPEKMDLSHLPGDWNLFELQIESPSLDAKTYILSRYQ